MQCLFGSARLSTIRLSVLPGFASCQPSISDGLPALAGEANTRKERTTEKAICRMISLLTNRHHGEQQHDPRLLGCHICNGDSNLVTANKTTAPPMSQPRRVAFSFGRAHVGQEYNVLRCRGEVPLPAGTRKVFRQGDGLQVL